MGFPIVYSCRSIVAGEKGSDPFMSFMSFKVYHGRKGGFILLRPLDELFAIFETAEVALTLSDECFTAVGLGLYALP